MKDDKVNAKKYLIILILKILETETNENNPITQTKIAGAISDVYPCDRKTVGRNIQFLKKVGYPIVKTSKGFYMDKKLFSFSEIDFIKESILSATSKTQEEKEEILDKLMSVIAKTYTKRK